MGSFEPGSTSAGEAVAAHERVDWPSVWHALAQRMREHRRLGRGSLLTEDVLRFETVLVLAELGVDASRITVEVRTSELAGAMLDLVVDGLPCGDLVEFKFPRSPATGSNASTQRAGDLLRDLLRAGKVPARSAWAVQLLDADLLRQLTAFAARARFAWPCNIADELHIDAGLVSRLPTTARVALSALAAPGLPAVRAVCVSAEPVDARLTLFAYRCNPEPAPVATVSASCQLPGEA